MSAENIFKTKEGQWIALAAVAAVVLYFVAKKLLNFGGGLLSGNNALTAGTDYAGTGIFGTLGAATNKVLGGAPDAVGNKIGSGLYGLFGAPTPGSGTFYTVTFPDGSRHAIDSSLVDPTTGVFAYNSTPYSLGVDPATGLRVAYAL